MKFNIKTLFSINILLIFMGTLFLNIYIDNNRFLIKYADDNLHYMVNSTILQNCNNKEDNSCIGINRLGNLSSLNFNKASKFDLERQKNRLTNSYHPLFTFFTKIFSSNQENFNSFKIIKYLLGAVLACLVFFYINIFLKDQKMVFLLIIIFTTHFFVKGAHGLNFATPATTSAFLSALSVVFLFNKKNLLFYIFIFLSITMHHVGLLFTMANYTAIKIYEFHFKNNYQGLFSKKNILEYLSVIIMMIFSYNLSYNLILENSSSLNSYELNLRNFDLFKVIKMNFFFLIKYFFITVCLINPLSMYFFTKFFFKKDKDIILLLKLMFVTSIFFIILVPIGSPESTITFAYGNRTWEIFILNFLILVFYFFSQINIKLDIILKYIFLYTIPIFLCVNILLLKDRVNFIINYDNFYHNDKNIEKFLVNTSDKDKILINLKEANFYYLLNSGLIKKNFFIKNLTNLEIEKNFDYMISENPLKLLNRSSIVIKNEDKIATNKDNKSIILVFYSTINQKLLINDRSFIISKGLNNINLSDKNFVFDNLNRSIYLVGLKLNNEQQFNWPWYSDFRFTIYTKIPKWHLFLDKKTNFIKTYDFVKINKYLNIKHNPNCQNKLISDVDTTLIFKLSCN